mmetsp:Transcript_30544/g.63904  ORF Transcript_30544/g.63904 Transcript_30544/m.63904 type:complete len:512 (-) Transcript_30544:889-2424(-)
MCSSDNASYSSGGSGPQHNGWNVPLGVHRIACCAPGLLVSTHLHRRSPAVKVNRRILDSADDPKSAHRRVEEDLIIPPGSYVEVLETHVHGDRVRGRICWEEKEAEEPGASAGGGKKKGIIKRKTARMLLKKQTSFRRKNNKFESEASATSKRIVKYEGWISLQWAKRSEQDRVAIEEDDDDSADKDLEGSYRTGDLKECGTVAADEDSGPWTEPVPLGVYRISNSLGGGGGVCGLPLRESSDPDSTVLGKLDCGRCVEVVHTQVKGYDQVVRARVIVHDLPRRVPRKADADNNGRGVGGGSDCYVGGGGNIANGDVGNKGMKVTSGWISLLDALTGSSGASPVPLGAYVVIADEPGCVVTEGGRLDSKVRETLLPGSCMEIVATRMEEGLVRGLVASGGHVTLFEIGAGIGMEGAMHGMPVPLGTYRIIQNALTVTSAVASYSSVVMKLHLNATVDIVETRVEEGGSSRVRGRIGNGSTRSSSSAVVGWITLFEVRRTKMRMYAHPQQQP